MRITRATMVVFLCFIFCCSASPADADEVSGKIIFLTGPSNVPVYWRGNGRKVGYQFGAEFLRKGTFCEYGFSFLGSGAAKFDNLDFAQFGPRVGCRIFHSRFTAEIVNWNGVPLAAKPVPDPHARRPGSYLNNTWAGFRYDPENAKFFKVKLVEFHYWHGLIGDLPVFSPRAISRPYASQYMSGTFAYAIKGFGLEYRPEAFSTDRFTRSRVINSLTIRHPLFGIVALVEAMQSSNLGTNIRGVGGVSVGFEIPFGVSDTRRTVVAEARTNLVEASTEADRVVTLSSEECAVIYSLLDTHSMEDTAQKLGMNVQQAKLLAQSARSKMRAGD